MFLSQLRNSSTKQLFQITFHSYLSMNLVRTSHKSSSSSALHVFNLESTLSLRKSSAISPDVSFVRKSWNGSTSKTSHSFSYLSIGMKLLPVSIGLIDLSPKSTNSASFSCEKPFRILYFLTFEPNIFRISIPFYVITLSFLSLQICSHIYERIVNI